MIFANFRRLALLATLGTLGTAAVATPALAKKGIVVMPASALASPDARICMPRSMSATVGRDKSQPATLCQTVADWATHGVTIVAK